MNSDRQAQAFDAISGLFERWTLASATGTVHAESILEVTQDPDNVRAAEVADCDLPLVRRLQNGDDGALDELMERYKQPLFRYIYRYVQNETDAADVLEATFVKLYQNRDRYSPKAKFRTWLYTIAGNLCRDRARKMKRRPEISTDDFYTDVSDPLPEHERFLTKVASPDEESVRNEEHAFVRQAVHALPHDLKAATLLYCLEGYTQEQVADRLGCSVKAVETRVYRANKLLAKRLAKVINV